MLVYNNCTGHSDCKITTKQVDTAHQQFGMNTNDADITINFIVEIVNIAAKPTREYNTECSMYSRKKNLHSYMRDKIWE